METRVIEIPAWSGLKPNQIAVFKHSTRPFWKLKILSPESSKGHVYYGSSVLPIMVPKDLLGGFSAELTTSDDPLEGAPGHVSRIAEIREVC